MANAQWDDFDGTIMIAPPPATAGEHHLADAAEEARTLAIRTRVRKRYTLEELMARCNPKSFERTPEDEEFLNSPPVGRELI